MLLLSSGFSSFLLNLIFSQFLASFLFSSVQVALAGESDIVQVKFFFLNLWRTFVKVEIRDVKGSDYELGGAAFTKELALKTKDNKAEKIRLTQKTNLFNKNVKVV